MKIQWKYNENTMKTQWNYNDVHCTFIAKYNETAMKLQRDVLQVMLHITSPSNTTVV